MNQGAWTLRAGCIVHLERLQVTHDGREHSLTAREAEVLAYLLEREGQDVSIDDLHTDVWKHAPRVVSRAAQNTLHRLKRKIERDPSRPELLVTVHGVGVRLLRADDVRDVRPAPDCDEPTLYGRDALVQHVQATTLEHAVVTLVGLGGIGKTRVARAVRSRTGGLWVDLVEATGRDAVLRALGSALGLGPTSDVRRLGCALVTRGVPVVVLDNVEHLLEPTRWLLDHLRAAAPAVRWLLTSRVRLGVDDEHLVEVPPLDTRGPTSPAAQLFLDRASAAPGPLEDVVRLVCRLDGIPLAIELAAGRTSLVDAARMATRLDDPGLLRRAGAGRHDALETVLEVSWSLLTPAARSALAQCSVFRAPFSLEAAEAVLHPPDDVYLLDVLQELVDASLVHRVEGPRLGMFDVVREFAAARLHDDGPATRHRALLVHARTRRRARRASCDSGLPVRPTQPVRWPCEQVRSPSHRPR